MSHCGGGKGGAQWYLTVGLQMTWPAKGIRILELTAANLLSTVNTCAWVTACTRVRVVAEALGINAHEPVYRFIHKCGRLQSKRWRGAV